MKEQSDDDSESFNISKMIKQAFIFMQLVLFVLITSCENIDSKPIEIDVSNEIVSPEHYIITKATSPIIIDGLENDDSWSLARWSEPFIDISCESEPQYETQIKMLWDDEFLYIYALLKEPHIWGNLRQRDTIIFYNNDFEVFIDPSGDTHNYAEIEINALGTVWDLLLNKPYRSGGFPNFQWNLNDLKTAIHIDGSLNNPNDIDSSWTVEMAIPMGPLLSLKNKPRKLPVEGETWRMNFSRVEWDFDLIGNKYDRKKEEGKYTKEYNWVWSCQKVINMHEPEKWAYLQFTGSNISENITYIEDADLSNKQTIYAVYREIIKGDLKELKSLHTNSQRTIKAKIDDHKFALISFNKTSLGFELIMDSSVHKKKLIMNESGKLIQS